MNYDRPELLDRLAAAYVFGTLSGAARRRFARLRLTLPSAEAAVVEWETRTAALALEVEAVDPAQHVWESIERRVGTSTPQQRPRRWWQQGFGFAFGVLAVVMVLQLYPPTVDVILPPTEHPTKGYVGILLDDTGTPAVLASSSRHGRSMFVTVLRPLAAPPGKVLQLWALPQRSAPFPLGTIPAQGKVVFGMDGTSEELLADVTRLAVSVEDGPSIAGDTPSPFIVAGFCVKLW